MPRKRKIDPRTLPDPLKNYGIPLAHFDVDKAIENSSIDFAVGATTRPQTGDRHRMSKLEDMALCGSFLSYAGPYLAFRYKGLTRSQALSELGIKAATRSRYKSWTQEGYTPFVEFSEVIAHLDNLYLAEDLNLIKAAAITTGDIKSRLSIHRSQNPAMRPAAQNQEAIMIAAQELLRLHVSAVEDGLRKRYTAGTRSARDATDLIELYREVIESLEDPDGNLEVEALEEGGDE